ncbi:hypothetical protein B0H10DRAFT_521952 [Mycena sp. CBHHK59/15]|nr:hypothetical protein B0H10DRAFT_521952 [Mycena sp. CBHHK59/15]
MNALSTFPFTDLPFDIIDPILSHVDSRRDLVSFATVSRACKELVIPRHTEYRILRLGVTVHQNVWAHLAQRSDLAWNIREVEIGRSLPDLSPPHFSATATAKPERYPVSLIEPPTDLEADILDIVASNICQALRNMHSMRSFTWFEACDPTGALHGVPWYYRSVLQALRESDSLVRLRIVDNTNAPSEAANDEDYPLWHIANLQTLVLKQMGWRLDGLVSLLSRSPNLQLAVESPIFASCRLPQLRKLNLTLAGTHDINIIGFLEHHPTIEDLRWYPTNESLRLGHGSLPVLKRLITSHSFACSILSDPTVLSRAIECISQISIDETTLAILGAIETSHLRDLRIWRYPGLELSIASQIFSLT